MSALMDSRPFVVFSDRPSTPFRKLLKAQGRVPLRLIRDRLGSYGAAHRTLMPSVVQSTK